MGDVTAISWTDKTWNPWQGCHRVSPGCAHCYMHAEKKRYGQDPTTVIRSKPSTFNAPLRWKEPARVFTCSWSDFFIEEADTWRDEAWDIIRRTPHLTYQILTKRPERILKSLPADWGQGYRNAWLGVTIEDEADGARRAGWLLDLPAAIRFVSCEPLLKPLDLAHLETIAPRPPHGPGVWLDALRGHVIGPDDMLGTHIDWVICGGESGAGARPMEIAWARSLRDQCGAAGVAFWMKQIGGHPNKRHRLEDLPEDLRIREFPRETP